MNETSLFIIFIVVIAISSVATGFLLALNMDFDIEDLKGTGIIVNDTICSELSDIFEVSECLRKDLRLFYKYNISNIGKNIDLERLKIEGGVCNHYADWYVEQLKKFDFYTDRVVIKVNESLSHIVAVTSNEDGYCILDQMEIGCVMFSKNVTGVKNG